MNIGNKKLETSFCLSLENGKIIKNGICIIGPSNNLYGVDYLQPQKTHR